jgi:hypothetical protein
MRTRLLHYNPTRGSLSRGSDQLLERISLSFTQSANLLLNKKEERWLLKGAAAIAHSGYGGRNHHLARGYSYLIPHLPTFVKNASTSLARGPLWMAA